MKKPTIKTLLKWLLCAQLLWSSHLFANLTLDETATDAQVVTQLEGPKVTISNFSVVAGTAEQFGIFTGGNSSTTPGPQLNIDQGIFMTTGRANTSGVNSYGGGAGPTYNAVKGANDASGISATVGLTYNDPQLTSIDSGAIYDPVILRMQAVTLDSYFKVSFVFASDEYPEYVCSKFNDPFGMFIKLASLPDTPANWINIGVIPGTSTPIAVNTINNGVCGTNADGTPAALTHSQYYVDNGTGLTPANNTNLQYDGLTVPFTVKAPVTPGVTYDVKIAIADAGDSALDGALFIKWLSSSNFSADADLELDLQADNTSLTVGDPVIFTLTVDNKGQDAASGIQASFPLPAGFTHAGDTAGGNYNPATGIWTIPGSLAALTGSTSIQVTATANSHGPVNAFAEISTVNASDVDSTPGNNAQSPAEDDEGTVTLTVAATLDYSDAPTTGTSYAEANHAITTGLRLGTAVTAETAVYDSPNADGDADDGVRRNGSTLQDQMLSNNIPTLLTVITSGSGRLHGWIDWDRDGTFGNNANELIVSETSDASGTRSITVTPPNNLAPGTSFARFRYAVDPAAAIPTGAASDGEVEDYRVFLSRGFSVSGRVFNDRNVNVTNDANEPGIAGVTVVLYDTNAATCISTRTDANGDYRLTDVDPGVYQVYEAAGESVPTPQNCGPANLKDPAGYLSTTGSDSMIFTVSNSDTSAVDFGDITPPLFELDNTKTILPNSAAVHPHIFTAQTDGSVNFSIAAENADPATLNWGRQLLLDNNCDGQLDSGDSALSANINLSAGQQVCILAKVLAPAAASASAMHTMNVQSDFTYGNGSILANDQQLQRDTTHTLAGNDTPDPVAGTGTLALVKSVWNVTRDIDGAVALPGETLRYTIAYENTGDGPLNEMIIQDSIPEATQIVPTSQLCPLANTPPELASCTITTDSMGSLSWKWTANDKLNPGSKGSVSYAVTVE